MYSNIYLKDFKIKQEDIIQPERIENLCKYYNFKLMRLHEINKIRHFPDNKYFFDLGDNPFDNSLLNKLINSNAKIITLNNWAKTDSRVHSTLHGVPDSRYQVVGNLDVIVEQFKKEKFYNNNLIYMNFLISENRGKHERNIVYNKFINKDYVTIGKHERNHNGHRKFIEEIYNHKFVLAPWGNGIDTHRLWMTLYLGSIPIVKYHKVYEQFKHLPILFVNDWDEITPNYLNKSFDEIHSKKYDMQIITMPYWKDLCARL